MSGTPRTDQREEACRGAGGDVLSFAFALCRELERDLARVAELSENMARRLAGRGWSAAEKAQHAADLAERDALLIAVRPSYADCIALREPTPTQGTAQ